MTTLTNHGSEGQHSHIECRQQAEVEEVEEGEEGEYPQKQQETQMIETMA